MLNVSTVIYVVPSHFVILILVIIFLCTTRLVSCGQCLQ